MFFTTTGQLLIDNQIEVSIKISKKLDKRYTSFLTRSGLADDNIVKWRAQLIVLIGKTIVDQTDKAVADELTDWAGQTAIGAVQYGVEIDELMLTVRCYRQMVWAYIQERIEIDSIKSSYILKVNQLIDAVLEQVTQIFSTTYVKHHTQTVTKAKKAFQEVSLPVVAISDKLAVLPLIGELQEERAGMLLEDVLPKCKKSGIDELIIDLSGSAHMDTFSINQLFQLKQALDLIGISTVFTGIRPELAIPMVTLGIRFETICIESSLKTALAKRKVL